MGVIQMTTFKDRGIKIVDPKAEARKSELTRRLKTRLQRKERQAENMKREIEKIKKEMGPSQ